MLTHRIPYPPDRGDRIRSYHILRHLSKFSNVWLASTNDERIEPEQLAHLKNLCEDVSVVETSGARRWFRAVSSGIKGRSLSEGLFQSRALKMKIETWTDQTQFDVVFVYCSSMMQYLATPRVHNKVFVDLIDLDSRKWEQHSAAARGWKRWIYSIEAQRIRALEREISTKADHVALISREEAELFDRLIAPQRSAIVVGNGVDVDYFKYRPTRSNAQTTRLCFVGVLDYGPNVDGLRWFAEEVMPHIRSDVEIDIVGRRPNDEVLRLRSDKINIHADVADVRPFIWRSDIVVAPLRLARGVQNKVLEAMACGKCVILTSAAAEGINARNDQHFIVADDERNFAFQIDALAQDAMRRTRIGEAAGQHVRARYTWEEQLRTLEQLLTSSLPQSRFSEESKLTPSIST